MATAANSKLDRAATLQLLVAIARAFKAVDDYVRPRLAAEGLSVMEFAVLEALHHKGPLPLGKLSETILVTGASTTYTVKKLEARGLIRRRASHQDQRFVFGELTRAGRQLIGKVFPSHVEHLRHAMHALSPDEKRIALKLMRKLESGLRGE